MDVVGFKRNVLNDCLSMQIMFETFNVPAMYVAIQVRRIRA